MNTFGAVQTNWTYGNNKIPATNSFQPDGWHTVTPRIITSEPDQLVRFVKEVFRATGDFLVNRPTEIRIVDSTIMISNGSGLREAVSAFLYVYFESLDDTYQRAVGAGAESLESPSGLPYGDRRAMVKDLWGNLWHIAWRKHGT
jgi:PhnB protein